MGNILNWTMIKAVIFDLDGLLADTEILHFKAYQKVMADHKIDLDMEQYRDHWIRQGRTIREFVKENNLPYDPKVLHEQKVANYLKLVDTDLKPMPHALETVEWITQKYKTAVATSSYLVGAGEVLKNLSIYDKFDIICTRDDVTNLKPHPDIFLLAANKLNVPPGECLVLEDAEKGIEAAYRAGMPSIAIPSEYTKDNNFAKATVVLKSLDKLTDDILKSHY